MLASGKITIGTQSLQLVLEQISYLYSPRVFHGGYAAVKIAIFMNRIVQSTAMNFIKFGAIEFTYIWKTIYYFINRFIFWERLQADHRLFTNIFL